MYIDNNEININNSNVNNNNVNNNTINKDKANSENEQNEYEENEDDNKNNQIESNDICCICHDDESSDKLIITKCRHTFHLKCILRWLRGEIKYTCPYCRTELYGFIFKFSCYDSDYNSYNLNYNSDDSDCDSNYDINNQINEYLENKYLENNCNAKINFNHNDKYIILYIQHLKNNKNNNKNILFIKRQELYEQLININQPLYWYDTKRTVLPMFEISLANNKYIISAFLRSILLFANVDYLYIQEHVDSFGCNKYLDCNNYSLKKCNIDIESVTCKSIYEWFMELLQFLLNPDDMEGYIHAIIQDLFQVVIREFDMLKDIYSYQTIGCAAVYIACELCNIQLSHQGETVGVKILSSFTKNTANEEEIQKYIDFLRNYLRDPKPGKCDKLELWAPNYIVFS